VLFLEMVPRCPQPLVFMRLALIMGKEKVLTWLVVRGYLVIIMRCCRWGVKGDVPTTVGWSEISWL